MNKERVRVWAFIVWQESALENWKKVLEDTHIPICISPLHDRDLADDNAENFIIGEDGKKYKKPHYHVIVNFSGVKTLEQVLELTHSINAGNPIKIQDIGGYTRYLIHEDNPDKFHYYKDDIVSLSGFDFEFYFDIPKSKVNKIIREICTWLIDNDVREFCDLVDYELVYQPDWFYVTMQVSTCSIEKFIKSRRHKNENLKNAEIDMETGEVVS